MLQQWPGPTSRGRGGSIHELPCSALTLPTVHVIGLRYVDPKRRWSEHKPPILEEFAIISMLFNWPPTEFSISEN